MQRMDCCKGIEAMSYSSVGPVNPTVESSYKVDKRCAIAR